MRFLLDTNVVSEALRPRPDPQVVDWVTQANEDALFISVITLAELRLGIERLPHGARRNRLDRWLTEELGPRFEERTYTIDAETANIWGRIVARGRATGRAVAVTDGFIAATVEQHDLTLVTRNVTDFDHLGVKLVNPWNGR